MTTTLYEESEDSEDSEVSTALATGPRHTDTCLLDYSVITTPGRLHTGNPGTVRVIVSNPGPRTVFCQDITISVPLGDNALDLCKRGFEIKAQPTKGWTFGRVTDNDIILLPPGEYARFLAKPEKPTHKGSGTAVQGQSLTITLPGLKINDASGTARIEIRERATTDPNKWPPSPHYTTRPLVKIPVQDDDTARHGNPITKFAPNRMSVKSGAEIRLSWECALPAGFEVRYPNDGSVKPNTKKNDNEKFAWYATVTRDASFLLAARVNDKHYYATTHVTVSNPVYPELTVPGMLHATGGVTVKGAGLAVEGGPVRVLGGQNWTRFDWKCPRHTKNEWVWRQYLAEADVFITGYVWLNHGIKKDPQKPLELQHQLKMQCADGEWYASSIGFAPGADQGSTFTVPVAKGQKFTLYVSGLPGGADEAFVAYYWRPLGYGTFKQPTQIGKSDYQGEAGFETPEVKAEAERPEG
ncbi:hypothetical protein [Streptomyces roseifaciens]|uniref:hypothetical protein n=1 Tax=Streptomyces roseifaciens TaxID=1488406 RepID=UPI00071810B3|nr:hypothetical protein [Streptomyces roseifaciens]